MKKSMAFLLIGSIFPIFGCENKTIITSQKGDSEVIIPYNSISTKKVAVNDTAYFASGCFWCVEEVFESMTGVGDVISGYVGGKIKNPSYEAVCSGTTGHAEAVLIPFDSTVVSYEVLLKAFFGSHDPSTLNQQGNDRGTQYRSLIMAKNSQQKTSAQLAISKEKENRKWSTITTQLIDFTQFYVAEDYHQNYVVNNPDNGYVMAVSIPRLNEFKKAFPNLLKKGK